MRVLFLIFIALLFNACSEKIEKKDNQKIVISTTIFPLYDILTHLVGDNAIVYKIIPNGVDLHGFQPTPQDIIKIKKSDFVFYLGDEYEPWLRNILGKRSKNYQISEYIDMIELSSHHKHGNKEHKESKFVHDPHYWMSIDEHRKITKKIFEILSNSDNSKELAYMLNATMYINSLVILKKDYTSTLEECKNNSIIVTHNAYNYLAKDFDFDIVSIGSVVDEDQIVAKKLTAIIEYAKAHNINTIALDAQANNNFTNMIADELNLKKVTLHPLGNISNDDEKSHKSYTTIMRDNLKAISSLLSCQ